MITIDRLMKLLEEADCDIALWEQDYDGWDEYIVEFPIRLNHKWHAGRTGSNRYKCLDDLHEHPPSCLEDFPEAYKDKKRWSDDKGYCTWQIEQWKKKYHDQLSEIPKQ